MFNKRLNQDPRALWKRYGIALFIILATLSASHIIESQAIKKAQADAATISLSGKQRLLSQKIILQAQDLVQTNQPDARGALQATLDQFEAAHELLMADAAQEASLGQIYMSRTPSTDEIVLDYISIARAIPSTVYPQALLDELKNKGEGIVLERLDEAVAGFEQRVNIQAQWAHELQVITVSVAAFIVLLEALLIFLPAHRMVQKSFLELRSAAEVDPLTGLRNRAGFDADIAAATADNEDAHVTLILFDLDDFKGINDRYGHAAGDAVLKEIADRVSRLPNLHSAARVDGDEFAILANNEPWQNSHLLAQLETDVRGAMAYVYRPVKYQGLLIPVSGATGLSRFPTDAANLEELRRTASASLLDAKRQGRGVLSIYNSRINSELYRRRAIQSALLSREYKADLSVVFQPIVDLTGQKIKSVEMLARWQHPELGWVNPQVFLEIARECGLGDEVERCLRALGLSQMGPALRAGRLESMSLNVSPLDLVTPGFADSLIEQIASHEIDPSQIWVEVTETERLTSLAMAHENLERLSAAGLRIALDDYGVGFSNIQRLAELPIQRVKIDKSIVQRIELDSRYAGVFRSSVQLARALGADIVAEGVETASQLVDITRLGCPLVQGYFFFKPMSIEDCIEHLDQRVPSAA